MDALLRYFYFFWWTTEHGVRKVERCMAKLARAPHTHHDDTTGPECGDCMLVDGVSGGPSQELRRPPNCRKPALENG